jgi:hypothetical protein
VEIFVHNPLGILAVAAIFWSGFIVLRRSALPRPRALLWPALAWTGWAIWEFLMARFSPEANIRVDLVLILLLVGVATLGGIVLVFVPRRSRDSA